MSRPLDPNRLIIAMRMIERAANVGAVCPDNGTLSEAIGAQSVSGGANVVAALETMGMIRVERFGASRIVTVLATGKTTGGERGKPHWRQLKQPKQKVSAPRQATSDEDVPVVRVNRDPCPRCGTRRDLGCRHGDARFVTVMGL